MEMGIEVRAGVHTGEVEFRYDDLVGLAVAIAKRVCDLAGSGEVYVSETVKGHLVGSGIALSLIGELMSLWESSTSGGCWSSRVDTPLALRRWRTLEGVPV
jgi:hypothetical protein